MFLMSSAGARAQIIGFIDGRGAISLFDANSVRGKQSLVFGVVFSAYVPSKFEYCQPEH